MCQARCPLKQNSVVANDHRQEINYFSVNLFLTIGIEKVFISKNFIRRKTRTKQETGFCENIICDRNLILRKLIHVKVCRFQWTPSLRVCCS